MQIILTDFLRTVRVSQETVLPQNSINTDRHNQFGEQSSEIQFSYNNI